MTIQIKPGETLSWTVVDDAGDLTGTTIEAALADDDSFYYELTVTPTNLAAGEYEISATDTSSFPLGRIPCDIKYTVDGIVTYSETFFVSVVRNITE